jgi:FtsP/CotA-like multicopper oxidase with cupredoxin domain
MSISLRRSIQQVLLAGGTAVFAVGALAAVGQQNPPPGPGQIPDYFGIAANFASSPQPVLAKVVTATGNGSGAAATTYDYVNDAATKNVMDVQGGTGYANGDSLTITDGGAGTCSVTVNNAVGGTILPHLDTTGAFASSGVNGLSACTGFTTPIAGSGIRKFVDSLSTLNTPNNLHQQLPIAVADTTTFPGSDYYEIAETEYHQKLHSDLPATTLRGYKQLNAPAGSAALSNQYLGPIIVAQKGRPVRVKLVNQLPTGALGKLPLPVDTTYMGADGAADTDNRAALHMHGGNTPWISDGTPRQWVKPKGENTGSGKNKGESVRNVPDMWFDVSGNVIASCSGATTCAVSGSTNNPGDGAMTFFFTNEQSARLMFYHDHTEGTTRLNVYNGVAAGYVIQDPTEQALVVDGTLPPLADTIPLVIQEKTFVPDKTQPVLNFYGPFKSQLESQDPTWRWGTANGVEPALLYNGNGDLWVPHIFIPNQNPGDVSGANATGRWDYGPWFWPPFANIQNGQMANPYYDPNCNTTTSYCEGQFIPGVPNGSLQSLLNGGDGTVQHPAVNGGVLDNSTGKVTESPSGTPEAFNDTPLVNGTAYPYINVDPKTYRLRMLSVGNDRMLNLSLLVAASKNSIDTTAGGAANPANTILCDGSDVTVNQADCTEVKMVPWNSAQDAVSHFPAWWYTKQKAGVTFDGRPSGVFDPNTRGPAMVQIGTEGGFLSSPVVINNQPVNYEYNPKNILIGNVKEKALFLGPAERADVLVDFSEYAGATLIMYNDAPAPNPAWDLRLDYYTGSYDNTDTGGSFSVIPGYGPNSRTLMQIRVSTNTTNGGAAHANLPASRDSTGTINLATLTTAVQTAFRTSQEPIIVPQSVYNATYGLNFTDSLGGDLSRISDSVLSYAPIAAVLDSITGKPTGNFTLQPKLTLPMEMEPKSIIEDWTANWGRMNALLGTEIPRTTATIQTSIPQAFVDPATELVKITPNDNMVPISGTAPDGTQIWKITHNGVDAHAIHFHLFHVQIVNRVGWDGAIYAPDANELGWKDTVRMNPLSDTIVALRPMTMTALPFKVPNSHHLLMPTEPQNAAASVTDQFNLNPITGNASDVTNLSVNYGWEYLWHCHILGHEENDMMRTIAVAQPPQPPKNLTAVKSGSGSSTKYLLSWTDDSIISNWVKIQRSTDSTFATGVTTINVPETECTSQAGCPRTYTDTSGAGTWYYRVQSNNTIGAGDGILDTPRLPDGTYGAFLPAELSTLTPGFAGYSNVTGNSDWAIPVTPKPILGLSVNSLSFGDVSTNQSVTKIVALTNTGNGPLTINSSTVSGSGFTKVNGGCGATLNAGATCNISVRFSPNSPGNKTGSLVITDNNNGVANSQQTVTLSGNGVGPTPTVSLSTTTLGFGDVMLGAPTTNVVTLTNSGTAALNIASATVTGTGFSRVPGGCGTTLNAGSTCNITVQAAPTALGAITGSLVITDNTGGVTGSQQTVSLSANGIALVVTANNDAASSTSTLLNSLLTNSTQTVTVNVRANDTPANTGAVTVGTMTKTATTTSATVAVTGNSIVLTLRGTGNTIALRQASKIGVYTIPYTLTVNGVSSQATVTITVN